MGKHVAIEVDTREIVKIMHERIDDILDFSAQQPNREYPYTKELADQDRKRYERELKRVAKERANHVWQAAQSIPNWTGSRLLVKPSSVSSSFGSGHTFMHDDGEVTNTVYVVVYKTTLTMAPGFTLFSDNTVDDVLDAGDRDFFTDPELEGDYFALVGELRHPGRSQKEADKTVALYTARPAKDRRLYEGARHIPSNIFLTTSFDEAEGYMVEFGGERDIWKVRIKKKHLIQTLDTPRIKNYQAFSSTGRVPVESIELA